MINHYRTLLLNQTDLGNPNEFICPGFQSLTLPPQLQNFYNLLYPKNSTRYYQQFIEYYCENLLYSTNQTQFLTSFDPRVTYDINLIGEYFQYNQISTPYSSAVGVSLLVNGTYSVKPTVDYYYDDFVIQQIGSTNTITVQSTVTGLYLNGSISSSSPITIPLTFVNKLSNTFQIGNTGLNAVISSSSTDITGLTNTQWTFSVQAPFFFDYNVFYNKFSSNASVITNMFSYGVVDSTSQALWQQHFNTVYGLAGLINAYVVKVNGICPT